MMEITDEMKEKHDKLKDIAEELIQEPKHTSITAWDDCDWKIQIIHNKTVYKSEFEDIEDLKKRILEGVMPGKTAFSAGRLRLEHSVEYKKSVDLLTRNLFLVDIDNDSRRTPIFQLVRDAGYWRFPKATDLAKRYGDIYQDTELKDSMRDCSFANLDERVREIPESKEEVDQE